MTDETKHAKTESEIFQMCINAQKQALGKIKVGAVCHGIRYKQGNGDHKYWSGANLHVSDSFADTHAEQLAVTLALLEGYYPVEIYVTSQSKDENVFLCGSCRHFISEINQICRIIVFNPDGTVKGYSYVNTEYPHMKNVNEKNIKFRDGRCTEK